MFTPLRFQSSLAAGGLALMPFVLMQVTLRHAGTLVGLHDVAAPGLDGGRVFLVSVLALYTHANYAPHPLLVSFAYVSTVAATGVYALVFAKFAGVYSARPVAVPSRPTV